jgi:hypothetical protein
MIFININNKTLMFFLGKILPKVDPQKSGSNLPKREKYFLKEVLTISIFKKK